MSRCGQSVNLSRLLLLLKDMPAYRELVSRLHALEGEHQVNLLDTAKSYLIAALHQELGIPVMVVTAQPETARKLHEQFQIWCPASVDLHRLAELDYIPYDTNQLSASGSQMPERLRTLASLAFSRFPMFCHPEAERQAGDQGYGTADDRSQVPIVAPPVIRPPLVVASALAFVARTVPVCDFVTASHALQIGMTTDPLGLLRRWQSMGYEVEDVVEVPGQMGKRGGIVDVFPPSSELPVRIEFSGDRIESMRCFEPESQRSRGMISSVTVTPAKEFVPLADRLQLPTLGWDGCAVDVRERLQEDLIRLSDGHWFPGAEFYSPLCNTGNVLDYLNEDSLLVLDDPAGIELVVTRLNAEADQLVATKIERGELPRGLTSQYVAWKELEGRVKERKRLTLETWNAVDSRGHALPFVRAPSFGSQMDRFLKTASRLVMQKQRVILVSHQANRLAELLAREDLHTSVVLEVKDLPPPGSITALQGSVDGGWSMNDSLILITDCELFGFVKQPRAAKRRSVSRRWLLPQLVPGAYVVHIDHGIARFNGLTRMVSHGIEGEYLVLEYAAGDKLYVPTERIDRVSRYIGAGDQPPLLSRLRGREWQRTKRRVKESVAEIAQELLDLYAAREVSPGFAFSADSLWQQELEASFPYMETPDQIEAIMAVKEDMERAKPADRLICGDVGYGKTEIALRAAFKAVMDNKQVAILVPTTVLAQQHLITFTERLQTFPVKVEMLSRFCPPEKEREIVRGLAEGTVDICIGTHRMLQKDIAFRDLGLVIVDEEQQFGVVQKERLRDMRKEVDTLALSATPIPRTLHMSLSGIRDMSIVETPPEDRLSVKTYVGVYNGTLVRQVILRELERNGQVFFVHNRVQSIGLAAFRLQDLVPEARIAVAHGQMPEEQLEKVMSEFVSGKYDVLLTTTIIQLGLDMPNVNTLIVDRADRFGLGQLYQLRGRVGRGINQAYAYFLFDRGKRLTPQAHKRLSTIFEATELGSGFGIAMKDLEIRGAGNLLGVKQSGHIAALGFDLYCQLLAEAVAELKATRSGLPPEGGRAPERGITKSDAAMQGEEAPAISLPLAAYIPEDYVPDLGTRLGLYHRLAGIQYPEETEEMARELRDRFGMIRQPVHNLLYVVKIRALAIQARVSSISTQGRHIVVRFRGTGRRFLAASPVSGAVTIGATQVRLNTRLLGDRWAEVLEEVLASNRAP
jgi:transcription-repair coupling factor (superfamily II helicase)